MMHDRYELPLSTRSGEARDAYVEAVDRSFAAEPGADDCLAEALAHDPGFALAQAAMARHHQLQGQLKAARDAADTAASLAEGTTQREQQHVTIIQKLVSGQIPDSLQLTKAHLADFPRDAFVLNPACGVFGSIGFSGRQNREPEQLELLEPLVDDYGDDWWFHTVYAFALLEAGQWERGRTLAERALALRPTSAHAAHTLAHALYEGGQDADATAFLEDWLPGMDPRSMLHCHNWWHYALLLLGAARHDEAWQVFSDNCLPGQTGSPAINVFTDSAAFLWRSALAGVPRDDATWARIRDYYEAQFHRPIVFVDAHAALPYAALRANDQLESCISELQELGAAGQLPAGTVAATLARAWAAFMDEDWPRVIEILEGVLDEVVRIGGSRAQRDLAVNSLLFAYVSADRPDAARALATRQQGRQPSRPVAGFKA